MVRFLETNFGDVVYRRHRTTPPSAEPLFVMERHVDYLLVCPLPTVYTALEAEFLLANFGEYMLSPQFSTQRLYRRDAQLCHTTPFPRRAAHPYRPRKKAA